MVPWWSAFHVYSALLSGKRGVSSFSFLNVRIAWEEVHQVLCSYIKKYKSDMNWVQQAKGASLLLELWGPSVQLLFENRCLRHKSKNVFSTDRLISPVITWGLMVHRHLEINLLLFHSVCRSLWLLNPQMWMKAHRIKRCESGLVGKILQ